MSYFVVGDIHGCSEQLRVLLTQNDSYRDRQVVFLGDYVDVGANSRAVIEQLIGFLNENPTSILLEGNHESALKTFLQTGDFASYVEVGGLATIRAYCRDVYGDVRRSLREALPAAHFELLGSLRTHFETPHYLFSHAGYSPREPLDRSRESMVLTSHQDLFNEPPTLNKVCVCGHYFQPTLAAYMTERVICLDTGCGILNGPLTAALLPERRLIQVAADLSVSALP